MRKSFEQSSADIDSAAVPEGSAEDMMMDAAQSAAPERNPQKGHGGRKGADRYDNGRYGRTGIHAHQGMSHNGKKNLRGC